jgi:ribosomal protein L37AE/L43A
MPPEEEFEQFWKVYPKKVAKGDARKAWLQTTKIRPPFAKLIKAIYAARASKQWLKDGGEFIPHAGSWLRGERWDDEMEVDLSQMRSPQGKVCAYCGKNSVGSVGGIWHCDDHWQDAMDGRKTKVVALGADGDMKPRRMLGVVAKPVAGRD